MTIFSIGSTLVDPDAERTTAFTRLEDDGVFGSVEEDDPSFFVALSQVNESSLVDGLVGEITLGVDD